MGTRGRPKQTPVLTDVDRETLERWARRPLSPQSLACRSRIVLASATGVTDQSIAGQEGVKVATVRKWRTRFLAKRLDGLVDEDRPGAPRTIGDDAVEALIVKTLDSKPGVDGHGVAATHWSTRSMAAATGMTQTAVSRVWRAFGLKPHLVDTFKLSNDPLFVEKVRDVVAMYLNPPEAAVVLCVDEKTGIQALDRTAPILNLRTGDSPERRSHDYVRNGTTNLFAALDVASGKVITSMSDQHRAIEFRSFLNKVNRSVPAELDVHLVLDNVSTHKAPEIKRWLIRHPRFHVHFTPTYSSWMNLVERWFAELTVKWLRRGTHHSVADLETAIGYWTSTWNDNPRPFVWHRTADEILDKLARYCERISNSGH
jgi:transposase